MAPAGEQWVLAGFAVSPGVGRERTFPQAGEDRQRLHRAAPWPFPGCKALLAAVESFRYVFFVDLSGTEC